MCFDHNWNNMRLTSSSHPVSVLLFCSDLRYSSYELTPSFLRPFSKVFFFVVFCWSGLNGELRCSALPHSFQWNSSIWSRSVNKPHKQCLSSLWFSSQRTCPLSLMFPYRYVLSLVTELIVLLTIVFMQMLMKPPGIHSIRASKKILWDTFKQDGKLQRRLFVFPGCVKHV